MEKSKFENKSVERADEGKEREKELSPEVIEKIMEKVQDINKKGTAYHVLGAYGERGNSLGKLPKVLHEGILGTGLHSGPWKEPWAEATRKREGGLWLCFNIVGRANSFKRTSDQNPIEIKKSYWWLSGSIGIIFDPSSFKEISPDERNKENKNVKSFWNAGEGMQEIWKKYFKGLRPGDPRILEHPEFERLKQHNIIDENGFPKADTEHGFEIFSRVSPRFFKGIVVARDFGGVKSLGLHGNSVEFEKEIIEIMQEEKVLLPVYDENGNLLWPKPMWYEQVKKFVAERDTKKEEKPEIL
ncbi:MAG: hypothetical protein HYT37_02960 [Candidatus Sungbacteria bacterium]|nr:hypothetical protein [Candidatus Sungbacteria bacterium]